MTKESDQYRTSAPTPIRKRAGSSKSAADSRTGLATNELIDKALDDFEQSIIDGRLEEIEGVIDQKLWRYRQRVPQVIVDRILGGRCKLPGIAFEVLLRFAREKAKGYLKTVASSPKVEDIVRFGARRRMGWPEKGEQKARTAFLESLHDPSSTLIDAARAAMAFWPPDGEILSEVVGYVQAGTQELGLDLISRATSDMQPAVAAWLLRPLLHVRYPEVRKAALRQLVKTDAYGSAGAIGRLAETTSDPDIRTEAEAVARRLQFRVVNRGQPLEQPTQELPPVESALASPIDGDGAQVLLLKRRWTPGLYLVADILHKDTYGIKDAFGFFRMTAEESDGVVEHFREDGVGMVEIDLALARGILASAVSVNSDTEHDILPAYEIWEPLFHDTFPPRADEQIAAPEMDDSSYGSRRDLYSKSDRLLEHPFFDSWFFNPEEIAPLLDQVPRPKGKKIEDAQLAPLIHVLVNDTVRHLIRQRLRRQALLLDRAGFAKERDISLAAAAWLADDRKGELAKHPLLRQMVAESIANLFAFLLA